MYSVGPKIFLTATLAFPAMASATTLYSAQSIRGVTVASRCDLTPQSGGLTNWAKAMKAAHWPSAKDAFFLAGPTFFGPDANSASQDAVAGVIGRVTATAIGLSADDASLAPERLQTLAKRTKAPWLASNVAYAKHAGLSARPFLALRLSGRRVSVAALTAARLRSKVEADGGTFVDPKTAVQNLRTEWNAKASAAPQLEVYLLDGFDQSDLQELSAWVGPTPVLFLGVARPSDILATEWVTPNAVAVTAAPLLRNVAAFQWLKAGKTLFNGEVFESARASYQSLSDVDPANRSEGVRRFLDRVAPFATEFRGQAPKKNDFVVKTLELNGATEGQSRASAKSPRRRGKIQQ